jgi:hypothetical protein
MVEKQWLVGVSQNHETMTLVFIGLEKLHSKVVHQIQNLLKQMRTTTTCPKPLPPLFGNKILTMETNSFHDKHSVVKSA